MSERIGYQIMDEEAPRVSGRGFFVRCTGQINEAHLDLISKITGIGHHEVYDNEESDYDLMFCPVVSRVGTDIGEAMTKLQAGKKTILIVMHHTFDRDHKVTKSSRHVDNVDVVLTVDCFFFNGQLLRCQQNKEAWAEIQRCLGVPPSTTVADCGNLKNFWAKDVRMPFILVVAMMIVIIIFVSLYIMEKEKGL